MLRKFNTAPRGQTGGVMNGARAEGYLPPAGCGRSQTSTLVVVIVIVAIILILAWVFCCSGCCKAMTGGACPTCGENECTCDYLEGGALKKKKKAGRKPAKKCKCGKCAACKAKKTKKTAKKAKKAAKKAGKRRENDDSFDDTYYELI